MRDFLRRWLGLEQDRRDAQAAAQGLVSGLFAEVRALEAKVAGYVPPPVSHVAECPNGHSGLMVMAVLEHVDSTTGGREPAGFGLHCPKCRASFYDLKGVRWMVEGTATEVGAGMEPHTPAGVVRDPETKRPQPRFRR